MKVRFWMMMFDDVETKSRLAPERVAPEVAPSNVLFDATLIVCWLVDHYFASMSVDDDAPSMPLQSEALGSSHRW